MFSALLSFSECLAIKYVLLNIEPCIVNNEPCLFRPNLIELIPIERNYYPSMISLDKCNGNCNAVDDLSTKICSQ